MARARPGDAFHAVEPFAGSGRGRKQWKSSAHLGQRCSGLAGASLEAAGRSNPAPGLNQIGGFG